MKRVYLKTYGCQMNVYDSERVKDVLAPHGYEVTDAADDADLVILNTCHIREKAAEKVYSELGRLRRSAGSARPMEVAAANGPTRMVVAGCVAQAEGEALASRAPFVDIVVGPQNYHRLPELLARTGGAERTVVDTQFPLESKFDHIPASEVASGISAFLTVQEGCDKFCTFCVVPYTRGAEESRPVTAILAEARALVARGARELILLGQNVNAYHGVGLDGREWGLGRLLRALAELDGIWRLRYTTSHPADMDDELMAAHGEVEALMPFLHLPVQSGADAVLKAMNRRGSADDYRRIVDRLRRVRPDLALSSDFIVGFPGETDADFEATMRLVDDVGFAQAFSFKYSRRPGTPAAIMRRQVPETVKADRLAALQQRLAEQQRRFNQSFIGHEVEVLVDRLGRKNGQVAGRTPHLQPVHLNGPPSLLNTRCMLRIEAAEPHSLAGRLAVPTDAEWGAVA